MTPKYPLLPRMRPSLIRLWHARRRLLMPAVGLLAACLGASATAETNQSPFRVVVVPSQETEIYQSFVQDLRNHLEQTDAESAAELRLLTPVELSGTVDRTGEFPPSDLIVPVGTKAALAVSRYGTDTPVLFTLLPESSYQAITKRFAQNFAQPRVYSAIFLDHPMGRHFALIDTALPTRTRVGIMLGPSNAGLKESLAAAASRFDLQVEIQTVSDESQIYERFDALIRKVDVVLAIPDPLVYTRHTIRNILITSFRYRKPVIGYSRAFVKAGALAALYSTPTHVSAETARVVDRLSRLPEPMLPAPTPPDEFTVNINYWVAESLGIDIDSESSVLKALRRKESARNE